MVIHIVLQDGRWPKHTTGNATSIAGQDLQRVYVGHDMQQRHRVLQDHVIITSLNNGLHMYGKDYNAASVCYEDAWQYKA